VPVAANRHATLSPRGQVLDRVLEIRKPSPDGPLALQGRVEASNVFAGVVHQQVLSVVFGERRRVLLVQPLVRPPDELLVVSACRRRGVARSSVPARPALARLPTPERAPVSPLRGFY